MARQRCVALAVCPVVFPVRLAPLRFWPRELGSLSLAAYPNPHASPLAQRARKAETGPDAVLKLAQRTRRTTATRTAAGPPAPGRASGVQTATPETSSSGGLKAPPAAHERTRMPGTITTRPPESGRYRRGGRTPGRARAEPPAIPENDAIITSRQARDALRSRRSRRRPARPASTGRARDSPHRRVAAQGRALRCARRREPKPATSAVKVTAARGRGRRRAG